MKFNEVIVEGVSEYDPKVMAGRKKAMKEAIKSVFKNDDFEIEESGHGVAFKVKSHKEDVKSDQMSKMLKDALESNKIFSDFGYSIQPTPDNCGIIVKHFFTSANKKYNEMWVNHKKHDTKEPLREELALSKADKKVILAFIEKQKASSKKFESTGERLDGLWMGGRDIAHWNGDKIFLTPDNGGKMLQTVQRFIKKNTVPSMLDSGESSKTEKKTVEESLDPKKLKQGTRLTAKVDFNFAGKNGRKVNVKTGDTFITTIPAHSIKDGVVQIDREKTAKIGLGYFFKLDDIEKFFSVEGQTDESLSEGITNQQRQVFVDIGVEILRNLTKNHPNEELTNVDDGVYALRKVMPKLYLPKDNPNYKAIEKYLPAKFDKGLFDNGDKNPDDSLWMSMDDSHHNTVFKQAAAKYLKMYGDSEVNESGGGVLSQALPIIARMSEQDIKEYENDLPLAAWSKEELKVVHAAVIKRKKQLGMK